MSNIELKPEEQRAFDSVAHSLITYGAIGVYTADGARYFERREDNKGPKPGYLSALGSLAAAQHLQSYEGAGEYVSFWSRKKEIRPSVEVEKEVESPHPNRLFGALGVKTTNIKKEWVTGEPIRRDDIRRHPLTGEDVPFSIMRYNFGSIKGHGGRFSLAVRSQGAIMIEGGVPTAEGKKILPIFKERPEVVRALAETVRAGILEGYQGADINPTRYSAVPDDWPLILAKRGPNDKEFEIDVAEKPIGNISPGPMQV